MVATIVPAIELAQEGWRWKVVGSSCGSGDIVARAQAGSGGIVAEEAEVEEVRLGGTSVTLEVWQLHQPGEGIVAWELVQGIGGFGLEKRGGRRRRHWLGLLREGRGVGGAAEPEHVACWVVMGLEDGQLGANLVREAQTDVVAIEVAPQSAQA